MTVQIRESVEIALPPPRVWEAIADYDFDLKWRDGLTEMTPDPRGPAELGTKVHEVVHSSGRDYVADTVVTDFQPGVSYRFSGEGTIGGVGGGRAVEPREDGDASLFTYAIDLDPKGAMKLMRPILGSMVRSGLKKDLNRLRSLLENGDRPVA